MYKKSFKQKRNYAREDAHYTVFLRCKTKRILGETAPMLPLGKFPPVLVIAHNRYYRAKPAKQI